MWSALLIDYFGIDEGGRLTIELAKVADTLIDQTPFQNGSAGLFTSFYRRIDEGKKQLCKELNKTGDGKVIQHVLNDFFTWYPECPLRFSSLTKYASGNLETYKVVLDKFSDRFSVLATHTMAIQVNYLLTMNRLFVKQDHQLPELKEIINYPDTESPKQLAAFLRNTVRMEFVPEHHPRDNHWVKYFWNQGLVLQPCTI